MSTRGESTHAERTFAIHWAAAVAITVKEIPE